MNTESRIESMMDSSREVIQDCVLPNGAIIAANSDLDVYPKTAINYRYYWPRDGAFILYASHLLDLSPDIKVQHAEWLLDRVEDFLPNGSLIKRYTTNGKHDLGTGHEYQPDQAASMLWSLDSISEESNKYIDQAMRLMANGLAKIWERTHFVHPEFPAQTLVQDIWEEQWVKSDHHNTFVYSLATAVYGLERAIERFKASSDAPTEVWAKAHNSMKQQLRAAKRYPSIPWKFPNHPQSRSIDGSLSGLIWPFEVFPDDQNIKLNTVNKISADLYDPATGVIRYKGDQYDGVHYENKISRDRISSGWPLLTFWHAISLHKLGEKQRARQIYEEQLERLPGKYIPEQIKAGESSPTSPMPLAWAHAMFVIATKELGYVD